MKKAVLMPLMVLVVLLMITPVMAPATKTSSTGEFFGILYAPGVQWISEEGIVQIRDAVGVGNVTGDLPGWMLFTMNAAFDPTTGEGRASGTYVFEDGYGTYEGTWVMSILYWGGYIEGKSVARGTGAYEGMIFKNQFEGYNAYFGSPPYPWPPIWFYFEGTVLSP